jgi:drug/metabolite transporter (DMT)-like permease
MPPDTSQTLKGVLLMVGAMLIIPVVDGIAKYLTADYSAVFIGWARYAFAALLVLPLAALRHGRRIFPLERRAAHFMRTVFIILAMTLYFMAIATIPLATAATTALIGPVAAVVLSVFFLKEQLTPRKLISLALGLAGSLVILGLNGSVELGVLYALGSGLTFGCYMVATRHASRDSDPIQTLAFQVFYGALLLTPFALFSWSTPASGDLIFFIGIAVLSTLSHVMSISAFRFADASTLAPLVYVELVGVAIIGYFAFDEIPTVTTVFGAALIVAAGAILIQRSAAEPPPH